MNEHVIEYNIPASFSSIGGRGMGHEDTDIHIKGIKHLVTICTEGPIIRSERAVTRVSIVLLHTLSSIPAVHSVAAAKALAAWINPWSNFCLFL